jgi:hypothetical protein
MKRWADTPADIEALFEMRDKVIPLFCMGDIDVSVDVKDGKRLTGRLVAIQAGTRPLNGRVSHRGGLKLRTASGETIGLDYLEVGHIGRRDFR